MKLSLVPVLAYSTTPMPSVMVLGQRPSEPFVSRWEAKLVAQAIWYGILAADKKVVLAQHSLTAKDLSTPGSLGCIVRNALLRPGAWR